MPKKLTLYTDCISPYAYFAFEALESYRKLWEIEVDYVPVSLGIVMKESGNRPPISVPNKAKWLDKDVSRMAQEMGLAGMGRPKTFPYNTIKAQRVLQAVKMGESDADFIACVRAFWRAGWIHSQDMVSAEGIADALAKVLPRDKAESYVQKGDEKEAKAELVRNTNHVLENGCFGLPYICAERDGKTEWFWGSDRWSQVCRFMDLEWRGLEYCQRSSAHL